MKFQASVIVLDKRLAPLERVVAKKAEHLLSFLGLLRCSFEIYLVNNQFMRKNVLAFPHPKTFPKPDILGTFLGEVFLNPIFIKEASEDLDEMLIHGLLHLLGYDHMKRSDSISMEQKEKILKNKLRKQSP